MFFTFPMISHKALSNPAQDELGIRRAYPAFATRAVAWNLAKVMLIKDEVYTAALLTCPEKLKRDMRRYNVNLSRGDRITYSHYNRPEFVLFGRTLRFHWRSRNWQLRIMSRMRFLRSLMPSWHKKERAFRDWYTQIVESAEWADDNQYNLWLEALNSPETVTGFRDVRYPKQEAARVRAEQIIEQIDSGTTPPRPPVTVSLSSRVLTGQRV